MIAALLLWWAPGAADPASSFPVKIIVNPGVPGKSIQKQTLGQVFLRRVDRWGDGSPIHPVDMQLTSPPRRAFIKAVLGLSALDVQQYWVGQMSRGKIPPTVKKSEEEVIAFVAANPGAIGYVSEATPTPETVKVLPVE